MIEPLYTSISFDTFGCFVLEVDGRVTSWFAPEIPEPPEPEIVVDYDYVSGEVTE